MWKLIESYDAGGDLSKEWFVSYYYLKPDQLSTSREQEWGKFKIRNSINCLHTKTERRQQLKRIKRGITSLLKNGFNPYAEFHLGDNITYDGNTIVSWIDKFLDEIADDVKASTLRKYVTQLSLFRNWLIASGYAVYQIYNVKKDIIYSFLKHYQKTKEWENKTYNHYLNSIHCMFEHIMNNHDDIIEKNPCRTLKRLQVTKKGNRPFDNYEFKATLDYLRENDQTMYNFCRFLYYSCFRPDAECRMLKIGDIDLMARRIRIGSDITKAKATQVIPIDNEFADFIHSMRLEQYPRSYYVFGTNGVPGPKPAHKQFFSKYFLPIKRLLQLHPDVTLYAFKHTRVIHMVEDGETLHNIIKFTRHKTLAILMDYLKDMGVIVGETRNFKSRRI